MVDQNLRAIGEVTELRFPQHQRQRVGYAVAKLESHHGIFAERAVEDVEARLIGRKMTEGDEAIASLAVVKLEMALAESAAAAVLAAEAHWRAFQHQAAERQRLGRGPIHGRPIQNLVPFPQADGQLRMHVECGWKCRDAFHHALERSTVDRSVGTRARDLFRIHRAQFLHLEPLLLLLGCLVSLVQPGRHSRANLGHLCGIQKLFAHQTLRILHRD